jgi:hypothetical protein
LRTNAVIPLIRPQNVIKTDKNWQQPCCGEAGMLVAITIQDILIINKK